MPRPHIPNLQHIYKLITKSISLQITNHQQTHWLDTTSQISTIKKQSVERYKALKPTTIHPHHFLIIGWPVQLATGPVCADPRPALWGPPQQPLDRSDKKPLYPSRDVMFEYNLERPLCSARSRRWLTF